MLQFIHSRSIRNRRDHHDYWLDPTFRAFGGWYLTHPPDRTLVYLDEYEARQAKKRARETSAARGGDRQTSLEPRSSKRR